MDIRSRRARQTSPDRAKVCLQPRLKRVQVVYYISRNGHLEHPHYIEVTHYANQHLRLRDVIDKLTALRGKGMPLLYSWSCKRNYKNGYVWNDLAENDVIYPAEGAEYVLKGSELLDPCSESFRRIKLSNRQSIEESKCKRFDVILNGGHQETEKTRFVEEKEHEEEEEEEEEEYEDEEKTSFTSSTTTTHSRCSRGVSTDELEEQETHQNNPSESTRHDSSPPSESTRRDSSLPSEAAKITDKAKCQSNNASKRFEDGGGDRVPNESEPGRNSVLLQLIACGNFGVNKAKNVGNSKQNSVVRRTSSDLRQRVVCKTAMKEVVVEEEDMMINCMSENPRFFGNNSQSEEREYFSGSIVESTSDDRVLTEPGIKRSNSYKEEMSNKSGPAAKEEEAGEETDKAVARAAKCIPIKRPPCSSFSKQQKK